VKIEKKEENSKINQSNTAIITTYVRTGGRDDGLDVGVLLQRLHAFLPVHVVADALLDQVMHLCTIPPRMSLVNNASVHLDKNSAEIVRTQRKLTSLMYEAGDEEPLSPSMA
jgi:hypothetical protein